MGQAASTFTDPNVTQTLQNHTERLDNHEARITNTENNVKDLQDKTSTPSSTKTVIVPEVITQPGQVPPTPVLPQAPITIISASLYLDTKANHWCDITYSDNTKAELPDKSTDCGHYVGQLKN